MRRYGLVRVICAVFLIFALWAGEVGAEECDPVKPQPEEVELEEIQATETSEIPEARDAALEQPALSVEKAPEAAEEPEFAAEDPETSEALLAAEVEESEPSFESPDEISFAAELALAKVPAIELERAGYTIGVGETAVIRAQTEPENDALSYKSSKPKIASVSGSGKISAKHTGQAIISIQSESGAVAEVSVTVLKKPTSVFVESKKLTVAVGQAGRVKWSFKKGQGGSVTLSSNNKSVVSVDESGAFSANAPGTAKITVKTYNGKSATCTVSVKPEPEGVELSPQRLTLGVGQTAILAARTTNDSVGGFAFTSGDASVAIVDGQGRITALSEGTTQIVVSTYNGKVAACAVEVRPAPTEMTAAVSALKLGVGEKSSPLDVRLGDGSLSGGWTLELGNKKIAKIEKGVVVGVKKGKTTVRVRAYNGLTLSIPITVLNKPSSISLSSKKVRLEVGESATISVSFRSGQGGSWTCSSSKPEVVTVDAGGGIRAVGVGTAKITFKTYNGKTAVCTVTTLDPATELRFDESIDLALGEQTSLPIQALTAQGSAYQGEVKIKISPAGIVEYKNGKLKGKKRGSATLTVTAGTLRRTCAIRVLTYPEAHPFEAVAHRGGAAYWPENTVEAFKNAATTGVDAIELDVHTSRDGVQVVHHDRMMVVDGVEYDITRQTLDQLRLLKPDICTLEEALDVISGTKLKLFLELKDTADGRACTEAVKRHQMSERTTYISFSEKCLKAVRKADGSAKLGFLFKKTPSNLQKKAKELHVSALMPKASLLTQKLLDNWHKLGYRVGVWTVNDSAQMYKLRNMGVDYIVSDYPDRLNEAR